MAKKTRREFLSNVGVSMALAPLVLPLGGLATEEELGINPTKAMPSPLPPPPMIACDYRLLRHAAAIFTYNDEVFLIDPYLNQAISSTPLPVSNTELEDILKSVDAVLLTHAHSDHINITNRQRTLIKDKPFFCQSTVDGNYLRSIGMTDVRVIGSKIDFGDITIHKTDGRHGVGTGWDVSGFVFKAQDVKTVYIAGDTTYGKEVEDALRTHEPDITIVNTGAAGPASNPWTMTAEDVGSVAKFAKDTQIIAVHMEILPSADLTRSQLRKYTDDNNISKQVEIPEDGESINLCNFVGISEYTNRQDVVKLSPSPFSNRLKIEVPGKLIHIRVVDVQGRLINTLYKPEWDGKDQSGNLARNGMYVLMISTKTGMYTQQAILKR